MLSHLHTDTVHHIAYTAYCSNADLVDLVQCLHVGAAHGLPQVGHWYRVYRVVVLRLNTVEPHI